MSLADRTQTMSATIPLTVTLVINIIGESVEFGAIPSSITADEVREILAKATAFTDRAAALQKQFAADQDKATAEAEASTPLPIAPDAPQDAPEPAPTADVPAEDTTAPDATPAPAETAGDAE